MGRRPTLRRKGSYWFSEAGGVPRYFGRVDRVTQSEAMSQLWAALAESPDPQNPPAPPKGPTIDAIIERFMEWATRHRAPKTALERRRHLARLSAMRGSKPAESLTAQDLERLVKSLSTDYAIKHLTSVRALYRRAIKQGWIPPCDPFARFEFPRPDVKILRESDLPTNDEIERLYRRATGVVLDLLTLYHNTGCRTHEILEVRVDDFQRSTRCLILARHKRSATMRDPVPRTIHVNDAAFAVLERLCDGRGPEESIITNARGKPYVTSAVNGRFANLRKAAGVRDHITPYSFRHLFITDCLQAGIDPVVVAKLAGTSVGVIDRSYAHWRSDVFRDAQVRLEAMRSAATNRNL